MKKKLKYAAAAIVVFAAIYANNTNHLAAHREGTPVLLAHRGIAQRFDERELKNDTCTAARMLPPSHQYLENTIGSMRAGFAAGADIVEFDVHPTTDGEFAVFHDWTLDCRTDGHGITREHSMAYLKKLDIGHGYTADGGKTFPFRGQRKYPIPSLEEGLRAAPRTPLIFNFKSKDVGEADLLAAALRAAGRDVEGIGDAFYGDPAVVARIRTHFPKAWAWSKPGIKACTKAYALQGWFGIVPEVCRGETLAVPLNYQWAIPGWPDRTLARMKAAGTRVLILAPVGGDGPMGLSLPEQLGKIPRSYKGYVWVEDIWTVGPALRPGRDIRNQAQIDLSERALERRRKRS